MSLRSAGDVKSCWHAPSQTRPLKEWTESRLSGALGILRNPKWMAPETGGAGVGCFWLLGIGSIGSDRIG